MYMWISWQTAHLKNQLSQPIVIEQLQFSLYTEADAEAAKSEYQTGGDLTLEVMKRAAASEDAVGLPLNVQVVGRPWQEEVVLGAMKEVERVMIGSNSMHSASWDYILTI